MEDVGDNANSSNQDDDFIEDNIGVDLLQELFTVEVMNSKDTGAEVIEFINSLPTGRTKYHRGLTSNRVLKALKSRKILPERFHSINSYAAMNGNQRQFFEATLASISRTQNSEDFQAVVEAIVNVNRKSNDLIPAAPVEVGSAAVNRYALLCHAMIDPRLHPLWVEYNAAVPAADRRNRLTEGVSLHANEVADRLLVAIRDVVAADVTNLLKNDFNIFDTIHPEMGTLEDRVQLGTLCTQLKNNFDTLWYRLNKSGRNESGEILDVTAMQFCKYGQRTVNVSHFYQYLLWKDQDLLFLSNRLPDGVGIECGFDGEVEGYALASNRVTSSRRRAVSSSRSDPISEVTDASSTPASLGQVSVLSKKDKKKIEMQQEIGKSIATMMMATTGHSSASSPGSVQRKRRKEEAAIDLNESKKRLVDVNREAKEKQIALQGREAEVNMIRTAINDPSFQNLSTDLKAALQSRYAQLLLGDAGV